MNERCSTPECPAPPARSAVSWIRKVAGLDLRPFQREFISELLRTDAQGRRVYRTALLGMPRGSGKTELAAALALYLLDADPNAEIILAAGSRDQASIAWRAAAAMVMRSKDLSARFKVLRGNARPDHPLTLRRCVPPGRQRRRRR